MELEHKTGESRHFINWNISMSPSWFVADNSVAETECEPIEDLNARDETEAEEQAQQSSDLGNEINRGHS